MGPGQAAALFMAGTEGFQGAAGSFWLVSGSRKMVGSGGGGQSATGDWGIVGDIFPHPDLLLLVCQGRWLITWDVPRIRDVMDIKSAGQWGGLGQFCSQMCEKA